MVMMFLFFNVLDVSLFYLDEGDLPSLSSNFSQQGKYDGDGDNATTPLMISKDTKLLTIVDACIFTVKHDQLNASFMKVFNLIH